MSFEPFQNNRCLWRSVNSSNENQDSLPRRSTFNERKSSFLLLSFPLKTPQSYVVLGTKSWFSEKSVGKPVYDKSSIQFNIIPWLSIIIPTSVEFLWLLLGGGGGGRVAAITPSVCRDGEPEDDTKHMKAERTESQNLICPYNTDIKLANQTAMVRLYSFQRRKMSSFYVCQTLY